MQSLDLHLQYASACEPLETIFETVLEIIHPTKQAASVRHAIIEVINRFIHQAHPKAIAFSYGSYPLKLYLPDGDVDIGVCVPPHDILKFFNQLQALFRDPSNSVKDENGQDVKIKIMSFINAKIPVLKVFANNVLVDISANTVGALSTACFLEEVDRKVGRDHLFKRTVLIAKCWGMYESRILASHHSLLSSFALETLVLYVVNEFFAELNTPLQMFAQFLKYFSSFDWDQYAITVRGPVLLSSLTNSTDHAAPSSAAIGSPLDDEFFKKCEEQYSRSSHHVGIGPMVKRAFVPKFMNIVDPLDPANNLGRSVNYSSFHRVKNCFQRGHQVLSDMYRTCSPGTPDVASYPDSPHPSTGSISPPCSTSSSPLLTVAMNPIKLYASRSASPATPGVLDVRSFFKHTFRKYSRGQRPDTTDDCSKNTLDDLSGNLEDLQRQLKVTSSFVATSKPRNNKSKVAARNAWFKSRQRQAPEGKNSWRSSRTSDRRTDSRVDSRKAANPPAEQPRRAPPPNEASAKSRNGVESNGPTDKTVVAAPQHQQEAAAKPSHSLPKKASSKAPREVARETLSSPTESQEPITKRMPKDLKPDIAPQAHIIKPKLSRPAPSSAGVWGQQSALKSVIKGLHSESAPNSSSHVPESAPSVEAKPVQSAEQLPSKPATPLNIWQRRAQHIKSSKPSKAAPTNNAPNVGTDDDRSRPEQPAAPGWSVVTSKGTKKKPGAGSSGREKGSRSTGRGNSSGRSDAMNWRRSGKK